MVYNKCIIDITSVFMWYEFRAELLVRRVLVEFLPQQETINAQQYWHALKITKRSVLNKKGMLLIRVCLHKKSAHTGLATKVLLDPFGWVYFEPSSVLPDLIIIFLPLKAHMGVIKCSTDEQVQKEDLK